MGNISDFPVEILAHIFQSVEIASQSLRPEAGPAQREFPFNTATVCVLWLNILKSRPDYWKTVTFDVAHDPTPLLDTLGLYVGDKITVHVISTASYRRNSENEGLIKLQERSRVHKIMTRLRAYLSICQSISFNLIYQSSLPSCADILTHSLPQLSSLILQCDAHDFDNPNIDINVNWEMISPRQHFRNPVFPALNFLALTGFSFMELSQLGPRWAREFRANGHYCVSINHFTFHKRRLEDGIGSRSIHSFLRTIALQGTYGAFELDLSNISIAYNPKIKSSEKYRIPFTSLKFDRVSQEFLAAFFASVTTAGLAAPVNWIHFERCSIPYIDRDARITTRELVIDKTVVSSYGLNAEAQLNDSIYNAISAFQPARLSISNCDDIPDTLFQWLSEEDDHIEAKTLSMLEIRYCRWFTSRGLCSFIQRRSEQSRRYGVGIVSPIDELVVRGEYYHSLAREDVQWFRANEDEIEVDWLVEAPEDDREGYVNVYKTYDQYRI